MLDPPSLLIVELEYAYQITILDGLYKKIKCYLKNSVKNFLEEIIEICHFAYSSFLLTVE